MSKEEQKCLIMSNPSSDIKPCTLKNSPVMGRSGTTGKITSTIVNNGTTANGDLAIDSSRSKTANIGPASRGQIILIPKISKSCQTRFKKMCLDVLEIEFLRDPNPTFIKRMEIAKLIKIKEDQVRRWFAKRRWKERKEMPQELQTTSRNQGSAPYWRGRWSEFIRSSFQNQHSVNPSPDAGPGQEVRFTIGEHPFVPSFNRDISGYGYGIPHQEPTRDGPFVLNCGRGFIGDQHKVSQQEGLQDIQQAVKDRYYSPVFLGSRTILRDPPPFIDDGIIFRDRQFVPIFYREVNGGDVYSVPWQQLPEVCYAGRDYYRCPWNPGSDTNRLHLVLRQGVGVESETQRDVHNGRFHQLENTTLLPRLYQLPYYTPLSASLVHGGLRF